MVAGPGSQPKTIVGTPGNDVLVGTAGPDVIVGLGGNDRLLGGGGNDVLNGGAGRDVLLSGQGNDRLFGGAGRDRLDGGPGNDVLDGGSDRDEILGGTGNDRLFGGAGNDILRGGRGTTFSPAGPATTCSTRHWARAAQRQRRQGHPVGKGPAVRHLERRLGVRRRPLRPARRPPDRRREALAVMLRLAGAVALATLTLSAAARADPAVIVGISDDAFKWSPETSLPVARDLGATAVRVTLRWQPGQREMSEQDRGDFDRLVSAAFGLRVVVSVYGAAEHAPRSIGDRSEYCSYVATVLDRYPTINDVVIWNEPNLGLFWWPQFAADGSSLAPAAYAELLADCWDTLHGARGNVNVISNVSSRGNDRPRAREQRLALTRRIRWRPRRRVPVAGQTRPLLDTFGLHPYAASNESPAFDHGASTQISQGDVP